MNESQPYTTVAIKKRRVKELDDLSEKMAEIGLENLSEDLKPYFDSTDDLSRKGLVIAGIGLLREKIEGIEKAKNEGYD